MRFRVWGPVYEVFHEASGPRDKYTKVQEQSAKLQQGCESILFMIEHLRTYDSAIFQLVELPSVSVGAACCREKRCSRRLLPNIWSFYNTKGISWVSQMATPPAAAAVV